jgi:hypothetical protein
MRFRVLIAAAAVGIAMTACVAPLAPVAPAPASPPPPVPPWQPSGQIAPAPVGAPCKNILLVGDSVTNEIQNPTPQLTNLYTQDGYCVHLTDASIPGSSPAADNVDGQTWTVHLQGLLSAETYDAVVVFFEGNGTEVENTVPPSSNSDATLAANEAESTNIVNLVQSSGAMLFWVNPPLSAFFCEWTASFNVNGYEAYRQWVNESLPSSIPRINGNVLSPLASSSERGSAEFNYDLSFSGAPVAVRQNDCLHLQGNGPSVLATEIAYTTSRALWPTAATQTNTPPRAPVTETVPTPVAP